MPYLINTNYLQTLVPNIKREVKLPHEEYHETFNDIYAKIIKSGKQIYTTEACLLKATPNNKIILSDEIVNRIVLIGKDIRRAMYVVYTLINDDTDETTAMDKIMHRYKLGSDFIDEACKSYVSINDPRTIAFKFLLMDQIVEKAFKNAYFFTFDMSNGRNGLSILHKTH